MLARDDDGLFHDDLSPVNHAVTIGQFASDAARRGLQYLGDAELREMFDHRGVLGRPGGDRIGWERQLDDLKLRRFRQTLLCRADIKLRVQPAAAMMDGFRFSAPAQVVEGGQLEGLRGVRITTADSAVRNVASVLGEVYPLPVPFEELAPYAGSEQAAREILFQLVQTGFANLHVHDFPCAPEPGVRPKASALARYQARRGLQVTSLYHQTVELDQAGRELLRQLDGRNEAGAIAAAVATSTGLPFGRVRRALPASLDWLARVGLLEQ
jgi:methyltransferase-like protein